MNIDRLTLDQIYDFEAKHPASVGCRTAAFVAPRQEPHATSKHGFPGNIEVVVLNPNTGERLTLKPVPVSKSKHRVKNTRVRRSTLKFRRLVNQSRTANRKGVKVRSVKHRSKMVA